MTHIILAGFMGTGKSTVGRRLAARLQLPFVDCDTEIEADAGMPIPRIFDREGETGFRERESRVLHALLKGEAAVLALGGGALSSPENLARVRRAGPLICLEASPAAIYARVQAQAGTRPLLKVAEPLTKIRELLDTRTATYAQADLRVDTTQLAPEAVVDEVLDWLNRVRVDLGDRSYDICIEEGCHGWLGEMLTRLPEKVSSVVLISQRQVDRHYGDAVRAGLDAAGLPHTTFFVPAGERYKSLETAGRLYGDLIQFRADRKTVIVALGGGVIGDLAGFVAATYQRGIRFVQLPTTLLAQVDSSVGGKVGVNHELGKNMVGAFLQPEMVLIDPASLATLPPREFRGGLAEVIKYGVIWDEPFFSYLETNVHAILRREREALRHIIRRSCQIKARVVGEDERDNGLRAILNYGHTAAHAVETYTSYQTYTHGEAVAVGMVVAARIAHGMGLLRAEPVHRLIRLLDAVELPTHLPKTDPGVLMSLMETDKKAVSGDVHFILPTDMGCVDVIPNVPRDIVRRALKESLEL